ncbi:MAG: ABC transporter permease [Puniceicoccaceae bacterium]|nr:MAG: ABC transporter permease [Puniceicoccaceae bacterium]
MILYILKRLGFGIPVVIGVSILVFLLMALIPGDPALALLGPYATEENTEQIREQLALDQPLPHRYATWIGNLARGDFGYAYSVDRAVAEEVAERAGATLLLAGAAFFICVVLGIGVGVVAAARQYSWADRLLSLSVMVGISTPAFWLGLVLIVVFSIQLRWLPSGGMVSIEGGGSVFDILWHLVLPAVTLGFIAAAVVARFVRTQMLEVLRQDFIRTARAKGLSEGRVIWGYALRAGIVATLPVLGLQAGFVLGGAVYVETIFQWPGIGRMLVTAIAQRDLLLVQGGVLVVAVFYVLVNLLADVLQHALDPRIER